MRRSFSLGVTCAVLGAAAIGVSAAPLEESCMPVSFEVAGGGTAEAILYQPYQLKTGQTTSVVMTACWTGGAGGFTDVQVSYKLMDGGNEVALDHRFDRLNSCHSFETRKTVRVEASNPGGPPKAVEFCYKFHDIHHP